MGIHLVTTPTMDLVKEMEEVEEVEEIQNTTIQIGNEPKKATKFNSMAIHGGCAPTTITAMASMSSTSQSTMQPGWKIRRRTKIIPTENNSLGGQLAWTVSQDY